jgi:iron complex outermembrane receptor protein
MIPGFDFGNQGRTNYAQNMRGRNVLVMLNGVSLNSTRASSRQFDAIDPFNIERIEVLSGASAIYGGDSTGGIINIITKKPTSNKLAFETSVGLKTGFHKDDLDKELLSPLKEVMIK